MTARGYYQLIPTTSNIPPIITTTTAKQKRAAILSILITIIVMVAYSYGTRAHPGPFGWFSGWFGHEDNRQYSRVLFNQLADPPFQPVIPRNYTNTQAKWMIELEELVEKRRDGNVFAAWRQWLSPYVNAVKPDISPIASTKRAVVIADGRRDDSILFLVRHTFHMLGSGWGLVLFCSSRNEEWLIEKLEIRPGGMGEHIQLHLVSPLQYEQANSLPMSRIFYEVIPPHCNTLLIVQPDGAMLRSVASPGPAREQFEQMVNQYIYLGAPWSWCFEEARADWCLFGGNGGFSLRDRAAMLELISTISCDAWHCDWMDEYQLRRDHPEWGQRVEDVFLAHRILDRGRFRWPNRIASIETQRQWGIESIDSNDPYFMHKAWLYLPQQRVIQLLAMVKRFYQQDL